MAFAIDASALHRPLGFDLSSGTMPRSVRVERHAPERDGAAAAALLPPEAIASGANRELRTLLRKSGGALATLDGPPDANPVASAVASARGIVDGQRVSILGFASGRVAAPERDALQLLLLTDARLAPATLEKLLGEVAGRSVGSIAGIATPRPEDRIVALANGVAGAAELEPDSIGYTTLLVGCVALAHALVRQLLEKSFAPASARLVQVTVSGAPGEELAARVAESLASDASTRAAMAGAGPSQALVARATGAAAVRSDWSARAAQAALRVDLGAGRGIATRWTSVRVDAAPPR